MLNILIKNTISNNLKTVSNFSSDNKFYLFTEYATNSKINSEKYY